MFGRREWVVALALLVTPAVGFGQWGATIDLNSGGSHMIDVAPGADFALTVGLDSNQPIGCIQFRLTVNDGADDHLFEGLFDPTDPNSYGCLFGSDDPNRFRPQDFISQMASGPVSLDYVGPEWICRMMGETGGTDMGIFPCSLVSYILTVPDTPDADYVISVADAILTNGQGNIGIDRGLQINTLNVHITPEPDSVLLLLAAVPFLFRRRG